MTAVGGVLVKKKESSKQAATGLMIVRGNTGNANGAVCSAKDKSQHADGLNISVRCCLIQTTSAADLTTGAVVETKTSQGKIMMPDYGGQAPGIDCPTMRGMEAAAADNFCQSASTAGLGVGLTYELCPTPADAVVQKGTGCLINSDWVWTNQACTVSAAPAAGR